MEMGKKLLLVQNFLESQTKDFKIVPSYEFQTNPTYRCPLFHITAFEGHWNYGFTKRRFL